MSQQHLEQVPLGRCQSHVNALVILSDAHTARCQVWGHRQQARANRRAGYLDGVLGTAEIVTLSAESPEKLTAHVADQIKQILGVSRCRFVVGPVRDPQVPLLGHEGRLSRSGKDVDVDRGGLPTDDDIALVVTRAGTVVGHFLLTSASQIARPTLEQRKVAILLADQVGQVVVEPKGRDRVLVRGGYGWGTSSFSTEFFDEGVRRRTPG